MSHQPARHSPAPARTADGTPPTASLRLPLVVGGLLFSIPLNEWLTSSVRLSETTGFEL